MKQLVVKVPGKVMLAGEYDVLEGGRALASSIDRYLTATFTKSDAVKGCEVHSNLWDHAQTINDAHTQSHTDPLLEAVAFGMQKYGSTGQKIVIDSDLDVSFGVGSSSALRLAVLTGLAVLSDTENLYSWDRAKYALELQKNAQPAASGYDIATQLCGGLIAFTPHEEFSLSVSAIESSNLQAINEFFHIFVGGGGAPTPPIMAATSQWLKQNDRFATLKPLSQELISTMIGWFNGKNDDAQLINTIKIHRQFFEKSPHFPHNILENLTPLDGFDHSFTFKTTGAGGEDAILLIGHEKDITEAQKSLHQIGWRKLDTTFNANGLEVCFRDRGDDDY